MAEAQPAEQDAAEAIVDLASQKLSSWTATLEADESGQRQLQVSTQQLDSLSSGDYIEINGETYKVGSSLVLRYFSISVLRLLVGWFIWQCYANYRFLWYFCHIPYVHKYSSSVNRLNL